MIAPVIPLPVANGLVAGDIGSSVQAWSATLDSLASNPIATAKGVKIVADGTALAAATPDFAGQPMIALDGGVGIPRTASPGHHTDSIIWQGPQVAESYHIFGGVAGIGSDGQLVSWSNNTPNAFTIISGGSYVDNVLYIENDSGGFHAIAAKDNATEIGAFGFAKLDGGGGYSLNAGCGYFEVGKPTGSSAKDLHRWVQRQYTTYSDTLYIYTRLMCDTDGSLKLFGVQAADDFTTGVTMSPALRVDPDGVRVSINTDTPQADVALTVNGAIYCGSNTGTIGLLLQGPAQLPEIFAAMPPSATGLARCIAYCSDDVGGPTIAFCDGTNWRRVQDRSVIST